MKIPSLLIILFIQNLNGMEMVFGYKMMPVIFPEFKNNNLEMYHVMVQIDKGYPLKSTDGTMFPSISVSVKDNRKNIVAAFSPSINTVELVEGFITFEINIKPGFIRESEIIFIKIGNNGPETFKYRIGSGKYPWKIDGKTVDLILE